MKQYKELIKHLDIDLCAYNSHDIILELKTKRRNYFRNEDIRYIAVFTEKVQRLTIFSDDFTNKFKYELTKKELLKYGNQGWNCFATLLVQNSKQLGWIKQQLFYKEHGSVTLKRCIGHGRTCHVFSGESHDRIIVAVKILKYKDNIEKEVNILKKLETLNSSNISSIFFQIQSLL
ncbi:7735_t:CDS:2 [Funneliformis mosseae]|uniref:7735_t:CDS:1 n=1 Tax=Funneliformis mosseae TaxID=27381 RepID=A0A9N9GF53_FUNMO|nr:7735_t:CDS:2 [Funneliformis mosseae]